MEIAVCVATFQRPDGLRTLLESLLDQRGIDPCFGIIVVDNDPIGSAREVVETVAAETTISIDYICEPNAGISAPRNTAVARAREWGVFALAFIDDDEFASPYWLATMERRLRVSGADAISGPVEPLFPSNAPGWVYTTRLYHRTTFADGAKLDYASTANSMLRLEAIAGIREPFNPVFGLTGGSDTFLYQTLRKRGGTIIWEPAGLVYEVVPETRLSLRWLLARGYRHGITLARCDWLIEDNWWTLGIRALRGMLQVPLGLVQVVTSLIRRDDQWRRGLVRVARSTGMLAGLTGLTYDEYQRIEEPSTSEGKSIPDK